MSKPALLVAESQQFSKHAVEILSSKFEVTLADFDRSQLLAEIYNYQYLWVRLRNLIDQEVFEIARKLSAVVTNTTGLNHIDLEAARKFDVEIYSLKGKTDFLKEIRATAEHTVAICLALLRHIPQAHLHVISQQWDRSLFQGSEIHRKTVGIIGYGRLGAIVANYFRAFGANVIVNSLELTPGERIDSLEVVSLEKLLSSSDIISLHANFLPENHGMIGESQFSLMKKSAVFINTARGELVDETALLKALEANQIAGAALDVLANEQGARDSQVRFANFARKSSKLILTPHIGGNTFESLEKTEVFLAEYLVNQVQQLGDSPSGA